MIRIAIPNKGRLHDPSLNLFAEAGLPILGGGNRKLFSKTQDPEISVLFARAADIPEYVQDGAADVGITGLDMIEESGSSVELMLDLNFGHADLVLAIPENVKANSPEDLEKFRVATEFPHIAKKYFQDKKVSVEIINVSGACEITPHIGVADAIIDISSSGTTLMMNKLKVIDTVYSSSVYLISNRNSLREKKKIAHIRSALESVLRAKGKRYLMMNVPSESLNYVKKVLPGMSGPTVMKVESDASIVAVHAVIDSDSIFSIVNNLKEAGAKDILVVPIERMMP
ncbi:ATP phosphoribosyltransferase [Methanosalsum natronophilum]|uniref:ATP phosphoribosyltransferase n=1 Tax=Methanosalsum natronophilum TaxID=768733 RepID=A0A3R7VPB8_9EURY|nr:MAG: ATP phosphoribosyltransferase [Methanosalsum natronophilum]